MSNVLLVNFLSQHTTSPQVRVVIHQMTKNSSNFAWDIVVGRDAMRMVHANMIHWNLMGTDSTNGFQSMMAYRPLQTLDPKANFDLQGGWVGAATLTDVKERNLKHWRSNFKRDGCEQLRFIRFRGLDQLSVINDEEKFVAFWRIEDSPKLLCW